MARPQLRHGYVQIALDYFFAFEALKLDGRERIVMAIAIAEAYGPRKQTRFKLPPTRIAAWSEQHRNNIYPAIKRLVAQGLLVPNDDDTTFSIGKDFEAWLPEGLPFAEARQGRLKRFVDQAFGYFRLWGREQNIPEGSNTNVLHDAIDSYCSDNKNVLPETIGSYCKSNTNLLQSTIGTCARDLDLEKEKEKEEKERLIPFRTGTVSPEPAPLRSDPLAEPLETYTDHNDEVRPIELEQNSDEDVRAVAEIADSLFPCLDFGIQVGRHRCVLKMSTLRYVLEEMANWRDPPTTFKAIKTRCATWDKRGGPPAPDPGSRKVDMKWLDDLGELELRLRAEKEAARGQAG